MVCIVFPIIYAYRENMDHKEIVLLSYFKTKLRSLLVNLFVIIITLRYVGGGEML